MHSLYHINHTIVTSSIRSPYIVTFYGASLQLRLCLVMEYCSRGSLYDLLNGPQLEFGWKELLGFAVQMVQGIQVLHTSTPQLLHRGIHSLLWMLQLTAVRCQEHEFFDY